MALLNCGKSLDEDTIRSTDHVADILDAYLANRLIPRTPHTPTSSPIKSPTTQEDSPAAQWRAEQEATKRRGDAAAAKKANAELAASKLAADADAQAEALQSSSNVSVCSEGGGFVL